MYAVVYAFHVKENKKDDFLSAWKEMTELIYECEGSLGSRIHKSEQENIYIAYAQWPTKASFENSGNKLPETANQVRERMREVCTKVEILHRLDCETDLLKSNTFSQA